jgi:uncharacterized protein YbaR (Trm112 family)
MFIPLVDSLRCPNVHEETWLVASIDRAEDRDIKEGFLGCPSCMAEYPIRDGIVYFSSDAARGEFVAPREAEAMRLAAALDLTDPRMSAVLQGAWGAHAPIVRGLTPAQLILVNPPEGVISGDGISIAIADRAPIAAASMDAAAADASASPAMVASLQSTLRGGKRMLAPVAVPLPPSLTELARDADVWVAQLDVATVTSGPVPLTPRSRKASQ